MALALLHPALALALALIVKFSASVLRVKCLALALLHPALALRVKSLALLHPALALTLALMLLALLTSLSKTLT
jgi:hypothetical protein